MDRTNAFVKSTQKDADFLTALVKSKMGVTPDQLDVERNFDVEFWYSGEFPDNMANTPPSDSLEKAF